MTISVPKGGGLEGLGCDVNPNLEMDKTCEHCKMGPLHNDLEISEDLKVQRGAGVLPA